MTRVRAGHSVGWIPLLGLSSEILKYAWPFSVENRPSDRDLSILMMRPLTRMTTESNQK